MINKNNYKNVENRSHLLSRQDLLSLLILCVLSVTLIYLPFHKYISILIQLTITISILILFRSRPINLIISILLLNVMPEKVLAVLGLYSNGYYLNSSSCIFIILAFIFYRVLIEKKYLIYYISELNLFGVYGLLSIVWTINNTNYNASFYLLCVLFIFMAAFVKSEYDVAFFIVAYIFSTFLFCLLTLPKLSQNQTSLSRIISGNLDSNFASFYLVLAIISIVVLIKKYGTQLIFMEKAFLIGLIAIFMIPLSLYASRTAFLVLAIVFFLMFKPNLKTIFVVVFAGLGLKYLVDHTDLFYVIISRFSGDGIDTGNGRTIVWKTLLEQFNVQQVFYSIFGNGYLTANQFTGNSQAHNSYIGVLIGFGIIGTLLFMINQIKLVLFFLFDKVYNPYIFLVLTLILYNFTLEAFFLKEGVLFYSVMTALIYISKKKEGEG